MSMTKDTIIDAESSATKAVNAAAVQIELDRIIEHTAICIETAVACTDSAYESDLLENLIKVLTTSARAAQMNAQIVLQLSQSALSSISSAVYIGDDEDEKAANLTKEEAQDEADFICDGSHPKDNKENWPSHLSDCSNRWLSDWSIHEYAGKVSKSCPRCGIAIKHNQEKVADDA